MPSKPAKRKAIPKSTRFEVFKRDSFTCQYCGQSAPDVKLHIDHIKPVSKGGENTILNLVTACQDCNLGKTNKELKDDAAVKQAHRQAAEIQERNEQIKMMAEWHYQLKQSSDRELDTVVQYWTDETGWSLSERGKKDARKLIKKYSMKQVFVAIDIAKEQYIVDHKDQKQIEMALEKLAGICCIKAQEKQKPYLSELFYIRGILRNQLSKIEHYNVIPLLESAVLAGVDIAYLKQQAKEANSWTGFAASIEEAMG